MHKTTIKRAFELASSGLCRDVEDISARLRREGYSEGHLEGPVIRRQLRQLILVAWKAVR